MIVTLSVIIAACAALKPSDTATATSNTKILSEVQDGAWVAPAEADNVKNPIATSEESIEEGLLVYKKNCRSCHGKLGDGKGVGAADLKVPATDFTSPAFTAQTDGAIQWKTNTGRGEMASYKDDLDEEEIWNVINYIRSLAK